MISIAAKQSYNDEVKPFYTQSPQALGHHNDTSSNFSFFSHYFQIGLLFSVVHTPSAVRTDRTTYRKTTNTQQQ